MKQEREKGLIFVVSGPSGSGKSTLLEKLLKQRVWKGRLAKSISLTTRPQRSYERNGQDYFFISKEKFGEHKRRKKILESTRYLGYDYATPKDFVAKQLRAGKHLILCLDLKGALRIKHFYPRNTVTIFILPPSLTELKKRISQRCQKTRHEEIKKRLNLAKKELLASRKYDYCLANKEFHQALNRLKGLIVKEIKARER